MLLIKTYPDDGASGFGNSLHENQNSQQDKVENFMGGISYKLNPLDTLKMITASSIFGEPSYYRDGEFAPKRLNDAVFAFNVLFAPYAIFGDECNGKKTSEIMEEAIDEALSFDFGETVRWAETLRHEYSMRLNPQVIMVRAAAHIGRRAFTDANPGKFDVINQRVMSRADEPAAQFAYWLFKKGSKNDIPCILKKSWAKRLSRLTRYELYKYKNAGIGLVDMVRISHAKGSRIDELMKTGTIDVKEDSATWEALRSSGCLWSEIVEQIDLPHMALLRNLRGMFEEIDDLDVCRCILEKLKNGVKGGKQFPFRYWSAMKAISVSDANHKEMKFPLTFWPAMNSISAFGVNKKALLMNTLDECVDLAMENLPKLKGKTMCLSDNSGSAWGTFNSEYGTVTIAEINNLSSVIAAANSDEGYVGEFGNKLIVKQIFKNHGILEQSQSISSQMGNDVGRDTENGIWIFFDQAIKKREHWDNIFIYSDQQAGHGGLYGTDDGVHAYSQKGFAVNENYIDVAKLVACYRAHVNPNVNVFSIQTAGYNNVCLPEYSYRTNIMYGWTGKELQFAKTIIDFWDDLDGRNTTIKNDPREL